MRKMKVEIMLGKAGEEGPRGGKKCGAKEIIVEVVGEAERFWFILKQKKQTC